MELFKFLFIATLNFSLLYAAIYFIEENKINFKVQRFIFLSIFLISVLIPLIHLNFFLTTTNQPNILIVKTIKEFVVGQDNTSFTRGNCFEQSDWRQLVVSGYFIISGFFLLRIIIAFINILILYFTSKIDQKMGYTLAFHPKINTPFTFFKYIFIPKQIKFHNDLNFILPHEIEHVRDFHSIDIVIANIYCSIFWFNPLAWKLKNKIRLNHEYIADNAVVESGLDTNQYQLALVKQIEEKNFINISSNFNQSIKKRIVMMSNKKFSSTKRALLFKLLPLFLFAILFTGYINGQITSQNKNSAVINPEWHDMKYISMSKSDLLSFNNRITSLYKYYGLDLDTRIVYYEVLSVNPGNNPIKFIKTDMNFDGQLLKEIKNSKKGQKFYFLNITAVDSNGKSKDLDAALVEINGK